MAIGLLLGTSMAQAAMEVCVDGDTVTGIKSLDAFFDSYGQVTIDVDFKYTTGFDVYGPELGNFPFNGLGAEEDALAALAQINDALAAWNPVPDYAGQTGQDVYFIGAEEETAGNAGLIAAVGSENPTGEFWDPCTQLNDCLASAAILKADERFTYADLSKADGLGCGNSPPDVFPITPGITGSWFDPTRSGEGFQVEVIGPALDPLVAAYFFTYDDSGNQMWINGVGDVNGDTSIVPMTVTSGPVFGPGFDPDDLILEDWGTITFTFSSCNAGTAEYVSTNFGSGTFNIERLTSISGSTCP
jgi:hypothetical protein